MKYLLLLLTLPCFCQQLTADQQEIIALELSRLQPDFMNKGDKEVLGDSIPIYKTVMAFSNDTLSRLKEWCLGTGYLTTAETKEIFGTYAKREYVRNELPSEWKKSDFSRHKVFLFDTNKHSAEFNSPSKIKTTQKITIGTSRVLTISCPLIREDRKFALIATDSEYHAGILSIYKNIDGKWELYKAIQLYYN